MKPDIIRPNIKNFIKSLRDMGYTFEIALADIIDNSLSANADEISIYTSEDPKFIVTVLDNGYGMNQEQLIESMRLGSKDPDIERSKEDLGRFGLGLKTASFSQCKKLTVITKQKSKIYARQWDLDYLINEDEWYLLTPHQAELEALPQYELLKKLNSGTLVVWESIDTLESSSFTNTIYKLRDHLSLVFHRFIEGDANKAKIKITVNNIPLDPFNPFNENHKATQKPPLEKIKIENSFAFIQPYILPHHSKVSKQEYEKYATDEGYTKQQGFYLYRGGRLLIHGTWWGLNKINEAHKLVRIKIDIPNNQDHLWNIDVKKSTAAPNSFIKSHLKRILQNVLDKGSRVYTGRARPVNEVSSIPFWKVTLDSDHIHFLINKDHPLFELLKSSSTDSILLLNYIKSLEAFLPIPAIQSHLINEPHKINQRTLMSENEIIDLAQKLRQMNLSEEHIQQILETEMFKNKRELLLYEPNSSKDL
ncbi:ATP-binding protein [Siminovitchia terrae]|nr:ATP-binding protein [Siminovitchia terrae]